MKISVIITSFDQERYLGEAIDSVLGQTIAPHEIVVADDCSGDGSRELIRAYERRHPGRIRALLRAANLGIPGNKNSALEQVEGDWVVCLDGDDRLLPAKLERDVETARAAPDARVIASNYYLIDESGERLSTWAEPDQEVPSGRVLAQVLCKDYPRRSLFRSELMHYASLREVGFYDPDMRLYEDWELRVRLAHRYEIAYCAEPLVEYRLHPGGASRADAAQHLRYMRLLLSKNRHLLRELPPSQRESVRRGLFCLFATMAGRATEQTLEAGRFAAAISLWLQYLRWNRGRPKLGPLRRAWQRRRARRQTDE